MGKAYDLAVKLQQRTYEFLLIQKDGVAPEDEEVTEELTRILNVCLEFSDNKKTRKRIKKVLNHIGREG